MRGLGRSPLNCHTQVGGIMLTRSLSGSHASSKERDRAAELREAEGSKILGTTHEIQQKVLKN
jgi:hypothetical protein